MNQMEITSAWKNCFPPLGSNAVEGLVTPDAPPMEKILGSISDVVEIIDPKGVIIYSNISQARMKKLGLDRVLGSRCSAVYRNICGSCDDCPLNEVMITGRRQTRDNRIVFHGGKSFWVRQRLYPVFNEKGWVSAVLRIAFDITDEKRKEQAESKYLDTLEQSLHNRIQGKTPVMIQDLSAREMEIVPLMADGMSNPEIARLLGISPHTVKTHVVSILNKLNAKDRTQAAVTAARLNII